jgi:hypothetical protein
MSKNFMSTGIAEMLMRSTSKNQIGSVKRGLCTEAISSKNILLYTYYL